MPMFNSPRGVSRGLFLILGCQPGVYALNINNGVPTFLFPNGSQAGEIFGSGTFNALRGSTVNQIGWYEIRDARLDANVWVRAADVITSAGCELPSTF